MPPTSEPDYTVETVGYECNVCGFVYSTTYHPNCGSEGRKPVIYMKDGWTCAACNGSINVTNTCAECGAAVEIKRVTVPLDHSVTAPPSSIEAYIFEGTNKKRSQNKISKLSYSNHLAAVAHHHSRDMRERNYFNHDTPEGRSAKGRCKAMNVSDPNVAENISERSMRPNQTGEKLAEDIIDSWMDSPGHRKNILNSQYDEIGVGVYYDNRRLCATQLFR